MAVTKSELSVTMVAGETSLKFHLNTANHQLPRGKKQQVPLGILHTGNLQDCTSPNAV